MKAYLLDADIVIGFLKNREPGVSVLTTLDGQDLYIDPIAYSEILYGIAKSYHPKKNKTYFNELIKQFNISFVDINKNTSSKFIDIKVYLEKKGKRLADFDLLIASSALANNLTLVTNNTKHFQRIPKLKMYKVK